MKTNDYGAELDRAGYAPSIMQPARRGHYCYLCGLPAGREKMDRHEPFGAASRQKSKELGLWVELHHWGCHEGPDSVHGGNGAAARQLRADAQTAAMLRYGWNRERWIEEFGKSELSEEECAQLSAPAFNTAPPTVPPVPSEGDADKEPEGKRRKTVGDVIKEIWPDCATTTKPSGFRLLPDADLPF